MVSALCILIYLHRKMRNVVMLQRLPCRAAFVCAATKTSWRSFGDENAAASTENLLWRDVPASDDSPQRSPESKSALRAITNQPDVRSVIVGVLSLGTKVFCTQSSVVCKHWYQRVSITASVQLPLPLHYSVNACLCVSVVCCRMCPITEFPTWLYFYIWMSYHGVSPSGCQCAGPGCGSQSQGCKGRLWPTQ